MNLSLLASYFEAETAEAVADAERRIRAASAGALDVARAERFPRAEEIAGTDDESRWIAGGGVAHRAVRSVELFGALGSAARAERIAHIDLPTPMPHPSVHHATLSLVPVLSPAARPPVLADGFYGPPQIDRLYAALVRFAPLLSYGDDVAAMLAPYLRALFDGWADRTWSSWSAPAHARAPAPDEPSGGAFSYELSASDDDPWSIGPRDAVAVRFVDAETLAVALPGTVLLVRWRSGEVTSAVASRGASLLAVDERGRAAMVGHAPSGRSIDVRALAREATAHAWEHAGGPTDDASLDAFAAAFPDDAEEYEERVFVLDLRTGRWGGEPLAGVPRVWCSEALEQSLLHDDEGRSTQLVELGDYPVRAEFTPDHRFVWVEDKHGNGGVFRARDAALIAAFAGERHDLDGSESGETPMLDVEGAVGTIGDPDAWYSLVDRPGPRASAIVRRSGGPFVTLDDEIVAEADRRLFALGFAPRVAAFDREGTHLALVDREALRIVAIDGDGRPRLAASWPMAGLTSSLA